MNVISVRQYKQLLKRNGMRVMSIAVVSSMLMMVIAPSYALALDSTQAATDNNADVSTNEVASALKNVDGVLSQSDQTKVTSDADSAMKAAVAGAQVDVPKDIKKGVELDADNGVALTISLPNAEDAGTAKTVAAGTVAYSGDNGSANAIQITENGGTRMLTVIDNPNAPTTYDYGVSVPVGGKVVITETGGAEVLDGEGNVIASVGVPWAKDANGKTIHTYFTTDGATLTQHIEHNVPGVVYPVTADPIWFAISGAVFWWAVARCGAGGSIGAVFDYVGGSRSPRAIAAAGAAGCISSFVGGWGILRNLVRIVRW